MKNRNLQIVVFAGLLVLSGCNLKKGNEPAAKEVIPDEHFNSIFMGECYGFTGGDGTYSVELPDGRNIWIFGDTFIGGIGPDNTRKPQVPRFVRNSVVVQDGDSIRTLIQQRNGVNASFAIPPPEKPGMEVNEDSTWFWPGDGYIENEELKIFYSEFMQTDTGMWDFKWMGTWIGSYELPGLEEIKLEKLNGNDTPVHFGHAVYAGKDYTYIYGRGDGKLHAARYKTGSYQNPWEYYSGEGWSSNIKNAAPMEDVDGSEQFSVFRIKDTYVLLSQLGWFSPDICSWTSDTPFGPWSNKQLLYSTPLPDQPHNLFTYNAVAHPQFMKGGMLLVSYNTNSTVLGDHFRDAGIYRPRFIRIPLQFIDPTF